MHRFQLSWWRRNPSGFPELLPVLPCLPNIRRFIKIPVCFPGKQSFSLIYRPTWLCSACYPQFRAWPMHRTVFRNAHFFFSSSFRKVPERYLDKLYYEFSTCNGREGVPTNFCTFPVISYGCCVLWSCQQHTWLSRLLNIKHWVPQTEAKRTAKGLTHRYILNTWWHNISAILEWNKTC